MAKPQQEDFVHFNVVGMRSCLSTVEQSLNLEVKISALDRIINYAEQLKKLLKGER